MNINVPIAGVVVLYNPDEKVLNNIKTYLDSVQVLFAIDNSENPRANFVTELVNISGKIEYIAMHGNQGISKALNIAAMSAIERSCTWLLTMDQDSSASPDMINLMLDCAQLPSSSNVGLISPYHWVDPENYCPGKTACEEVLTAMTSGNLLSLSAFRDVGCFREDFFIGYVDLEYCLRLRKNGFSILQSNRAVLTHELGKLSKHKLLWATLSTTNHPAIRLYYRTRNRLETMNLYRHDFPEFAKHEMSAMFKELVKILFFEKDSLSKLKSAFKGYVHYKKKTFGKYVE